MNRTVHGFSIDTLLDMRMKDNMKHTIYDLSEVSLVSNESSQPY